LLDLKEILAYKVLLDLLVLKVSQEPLGFKALAEQ
jgi:hypothetical protein